MVIIMGQSLRYDLDQLTSAILLGGRWDGGDWQYRTGLAGQSSAMQMIDGLVITIVFEGMLDFANFSYVAGWLLTPAVWGVLGQGLGPGVVGPIPSGDGVPHPIAGFFR